MTNDAKVNLWGRTIGAVTWLEDRELGVFQYAPDFLKSNIQLSPLKMPLRDFPYEFPALARNTFKGLPGLLADSLPDKFGNAVIDAWLASQGRSADSFHPIERLCYIGNRGMGALEFKPALLGPPTSKKAIEVASLVDLANRVLSQRESLNGVFTNHDDQKVIQDILRVGTSAGGARAKAILAWNPKTNQFRTGQVTTPDGYEQWLMKFDGIANNRDKELKDPKGYGRIEYAYYLMALKAGIVMSPSRLHHEGGRSHFMTKRFDRYGKNRKLHMQTLCAMAHFDYNQALSYSYEQALTVIKRLGLPREDLIQQVLRAFFNVIARNQDDHVKNIAFLMDRKGVWRLSPAYDVTYAFDPKGAWTSQHQMSLNGKRRNFKRDDLIALAKMAGIKKPKANQMIDRVLESVRKWPDLAEKAQVFKEHVGKIKNAHRINL